MIEPVGIGTAILSSMVKSLTTKALDSSIYKDVLKSEDAAELSTHLKEIAEWSSRVQVFGMANAFDTLEKTVALSISMTPRKFSRAFTDDEPKTETNILRPGKHTVVLGDPGSGKTTTIKRLIQYMLSSEQGEFDDLNYPIRVILRTLPDDPNLYLHLADCLGIVVTKAPQGIEFASKKYRYEINGKRIEDAIPEILNETKALLLIDGLDEISELAHRHIYYVLQELSGKLHASQIIVTTRSGDYNSQLEGFDVVELLPLSKPQIEGICKKTLTQPDAFIKELDRLPYKDLANRPLFLLYMMMVFEDREALPERPIDVYRRVLMLILEDWDRHRKIQRRSKYRNFDNDAKLDFLALLAFELVFEKKRKSFSRDELRQFYERHCERFNLPINEAELVVSEIESHTGIITETSWGDQEFSHFSLQEYLAALHLIREPNSAKMSKLVSIHPDTIAIAIALSSDAGAWLASLLLGTKQKPIRYIDLQKVIVRMRIERPHFYSSNVLGMAIMNVINMISCRSILEKNGSTDQAVSNSGLVEILDLLKIPTWKASFASAIASYWVDLNTYSGSKKTIEKFYENHTLEIVGNDYLVLEKRTEYEGDYEIDKAQTVIAPTFIIREIVEEFSPNLYGYKKGKQSIHIDNNFFSD